MKFSANLEDIMYTLKQILRYPSLACIRCWHIYDRQILSAVCLSRQSNTTTTHPWCFIKNTFYVNDNNLLMLLEAAFCS